MVKKQNYNKLTTVLLIIYLLILTWIILFKMQLSLENFGHYRSINLIPYAGSVIVNNKVQFSEIFQNMMIFIPAGIYLCMLKNDLSFLKKVLPVAAYSFFLEIMQYILAIGATDITDLINNTLGGVIGIGIYAAALRCFKTTAKTNKIFNILAMAGTICLCALMSILILANL